MNRIRIKRVIPLALMLLVAVLGAMVALAIAGGRDASAHGSADQQATRNLDGSRGKGRSRRRSLRSETRCAALETTSRGRGWRSSASLPIPPTPRRRSEGCREPDGHRRRDQAFYGEAAGEELTRLLREHILIAADIIAAARAGDGAGGGGPGPLAGERRRDRGLPAMRQPALVEAAEMQAMLYEHLRLTTDEVVARLQADWAADVAAYDEIHVQALEMADELSTGIVKQFPRRFG